MKEESVLREHQREDQREDRGCGTEAFCELSHHSWRDGIVFYVGITGLIYEVVWTRLLTYLFGATIYAISTVLSAFMGGLALGSIIFGRLADRWQLNSLKAYALLELFVGITALLLLVLLKLIEPIFGFVYQHWTESFFLLSLVRLILCFIVLLIPTTLMGGTLPLLSRFITHHQTTLGLRIGGLYAINTLGAVVGCFVAGFYLIALLGVRGTVYLAVGVDIIVHHFFFFFLSRGERERPGL